jgi:hypothetical protein
VFLLIFGAHRQRIGMLIVAKHPQSGGGGACLLIGVTRENGFSDMLERHVRWRLITMRMAAREVRSEINQR